MTVFAVIAAALMSSATAVRLRRGRMILLRWRSLRMRLLLRLRTVLTMRSLHTLRLWLCHWPVLDTWSLHARLRLWLRLGLRPVLSAGFRLP